MGIKGQFPDAILFFRMGDFYEMFFDDAQTASRILGVTLTSRGTYNGEKVPMCGIPHHAHRAYIGKLLDSGWKVAICEQVEDPGSTKGIVKREVVRLVTPGSVVDEKDLDDKSPLFMAAVSGDGRACGLAHLDLLTGEFRVTETDSFASLLNELERIDPAEVLIPEDDPLMNQKALAGYRLEVLKRDLYDPGDAPSLLKSQLQVGSLAGFGCQDMPQAVVAAGAIAAYILETQKGFPEHIREMATYHMGDYMVLDGSTCTHLELLKTMRRQSVKGSLFSVLDKTVTPMGSRLLKNWIAYPLVNLEKIRGRSAAVACLKEAPLLRRDVRDELKKIYDLARLNGRIALGRANARDLIALKTSLLSLPFIKNALADSNSALLSEIGARLDLLEDVVQLTGASIQEDPPVSLKEGGIIKEGYNGELDRLISLSREGKSWIAKFARFEQERTGISSLKVGYNKVFGYYIEVTRPNLHLVPDDYIRKQTLANGERYITEALKVKEEEVLGAEEKRIQLEGKIFEEIRRRIAQENWRIKETADLVSQIDVIAGLAETAEANDYTCPEVNDTADLDIVEGRHPVVELNVKDEDFVPNDIRLDAQNQQVMIITGPNMAGKSTVLRQTALTVLMAQMGAFVPASRAVIGLVDRIFTRVGASDDLARGQSTFMVEMTETANILRHMTPRSLVILDEIGRGTSTFDGLSIAWAVAEALHDRDGKGVRTLFATHYHELTELAAAKERVKNFNIAVREWNDRIIFLRKLVPGGASRSYGIQVAQIAGIPEEVIRRAREILNRLEETEGDGSGRPRLAGGGSPPDSGKGAMVQLPLFGSMDGEIREWIKRIDLETLTPIEALLTLNDLKKQVESGLI